MCLKLKNINWISIHSPYTGRDQFRDSYKPLYICNFNPLSLYRERHSGWNIVSFTDKFQSTLPIQGETSGGINGYSPSGISIHSPYTGRDECYGEVFFRHRISIHSPYTGRDTFPAKVDTSTEEFQSTLPIQGETTKKSSKALENMVFQSTLPIQGETDNRKSSIRLEIFQSTLPIQGETRQKGKVATLALDFNPLSLYRERHLYRGWLERNQIFQSTLPIQGETQFSDNQHPRTSYFNPLSLYRERPSQKMVKLFANYFNPLSLYRERQFKDAQGSIWIRISIHSPYTGRDAKREKESSVFENFNPLSLYRERPHLTDPRKPDLRYFNPLSLYRERPKSSLEDLTTEVFQSTLPIQGETLDSQTIQPYSLISIHSPYTGRDVRRAERSRWRCCISIHSPYTGRDTPQSTDILQLFIYFNPLSLYRERPPEEREVVLYMDISIHSPYTGRDSAALLTNPLWDYFNPLSLYRERPLGLRVALLTK